MIKERKKYFRESFAEKDLTGQDLSFTDFICCDFRKANLTDADCTHSDFSGSNLTGTKCTRTNFRNACLACIFYPTDCLGMTLTLHCRTFRGMSISKIWWYGFIYCAMLMSPEKEKDKDPRDILINLMGAEKYIKLKHLFNTRQL